MSLNYRSVISGNVPSLPRPNQTKPVVLMVGDCLDAQSELKEALKRKGYSVIDTDNERDAAAQARQNRPDLLLVDMDVPLLCGLVAARQIVKDSELDPLPVVIVTREEVVDPMPFNELGANRNEYVTRLSDYAELQPLLDYLLPMLPQTDGTHLMIEREPIAVPVPSILFD